MKPSPGLAHSRDARRGRGRAADEGDAGEFALEVGGVALAVLGMMQHGIDVVEDVPLGDVGVGVVGAELVQRPVGDVFAAIGAVFVVGVERETLRSSPWTGKVRVGYKVWMQNIRPETVSRNRTSGGDKIRSGLRVRVIFWGRNAGIRITTLVFELPRQNTDP